MKNLEKFNDIPARLRNRIFAKAFASAEIARFNPMQAHEDSLKQYRDLKNVIDTAFDEGIEQVIKKALFLLPRTQFAKDCPTN